MTPKFLPAADPAPPPADRPVRVRNAACPRCGAGVWYSKTHWLHCRRCPRRVAVTPRPEDSPR